MRFSQTSERVVSIEAGEARLGEYYVLSTHLPKHVQETIGIVLLDPQSDDLYIRLRRDWRSIAEKDDWEVLEELENDLELKARELGGAALLELLESGASWTVALSGRNAVPVADFDRTLWQLYRQHVRATEQQFKTHLPIYSLEVAAGKFLSNANEVPAEKWVEIPPDLNLNENMFVATIRGDSMEPKIPNGSLCVFRGGVVGSRSKRLVLARNNTAEGDRFSVKSYRSEKVENDTTFAHTRIWLESLNLAFPSWDLDPEEDKYAIFAEFVRVLE